MGLPMALNLRNAGYSLRVYNRTAHKTQPLADAGATICDSPQEAAAGAAIVITILANDAAVEEVTAGEDGILNSLEAGGIHLSMSTIYPETARRLSALHDLRDSVYLGAPVYGRPPAAASGNLWMLLSGDATARQKVRPVLDTLGRGVYEFGDDPGAAHAVKVCGNFLIGAAIAGMAEAYTLAEKSGVDRGAFHEFLTETILAAPVYQVYGKLIATENYREVGFALPLGQKDIALAQRLGMETQTPLPLANLVQERLTASRARGRDDLDWAGFALEVSEAAGLAADRFEETPAQD
ncbi:MAG: NAD(P)-dependent oxidoreductase [Armatimonadaceae bacterium]